MKLNPDKCAYMSISFSKDPSIIVPAPKLNNVTLQKVDSTKILGVQISSDLKWSTHVNEMLKKANGRLQMVKMATLYTRTQTKKTLKALWLLLTLVKRLIT